DALGVQANLDPFGLENVLDGGRHILVFVLDEPRTHLDNRDVAAEAPEHLPELEADVAASDDDQVAGQKIDVHHRTVGEVRDFADPVQRRYRSPPAGIDENPRSGEPGIANAHFARRFE